MMSTQPGSLMLSEITEIPRVLSELSSSFASNIEAQQLLRDQKFNSIMLLARGTSDNAAHFFKYLIETKLGLPCGLVSPSAATTSNPIPSVSYGYCTTPKTQNSSTTACLS